MLKKVLLLVFSVFFSVWSVSAQVESKNQSKWHSVIIQTSGTCTHCKQKIETALAAENGVKSVNYDLASGKVKVVFNSRKTSSKQLRDAINKAGFDADNQKVNADRSACGSRKGCGAHEGHGNSACGGCSEHH